MKNRIFTNSIRTIFRMFPRFLSLLVISFLGSFSFLGLQSTAPNMLDTLDVYLDQNDVYDIRIISSLGLVEEDINCLKEVEGVKNIEGSYSEDILMHINDNEYVVNVESLPKDINKLDLISGRLPEKSNEIVVEENLLINNNLKIGDLLKFDESSLKVDSLKIVGSVNSHLYFNNVEISQNRGSTSIGSGTINYYSYVLDNLFDLDYYTSIYITLDNAKEEITSSDFYVDIIDSFISKIESIKKERELERYNDIKEEAVNEVELIEKKFSTQLKNFEKNIQDLENNIKQLEQDLYDLNEQIIQLEEEINNKLQIYNLTQDTYLNRIDELNEKLSLLDENDPIYQEALNELNYLLEVQKDIKTLENLNIEYTNTNSQYNLQLNLYEFNVNSKKKIEDGIKAAKEEIDTIPEGKWYVLDRRDNITYTEYVDDTGSIASLAKIFPIIFFLVAILISLVSMNRMVEDDRNEIGTLKSMGFSNRHIIIKYMLFAFLATVIGGVVGSILGAMMIPTIIYSIYSILFTLCPIVLVPKIEYYLIGNIINFTCILLTTYLTVIKVLKEKPSELMRPKAPKSGKRVYLEKIKFIWERLSFSSKVTIRNLFRYKKRVFVTVFGVAGCTALMMCGFGVKDSIVDIPDYQFGKVFTFDAMVYVQNYHEEKDSIIFENDKITSTIQIQNMSVDVEGKKATMFVINNKEDTNNFINLYNFDTLEEYELEYNRIVITKKLSQLLDVNVGDKLSFYDNNNISYEYEVSSIVANYMEHYIFIDSSTYELSKQKFTPNTISIQTKDLTNAEREELSKELLKSDKVISISYVSTLVDTVTNMIQSLDKVVLVLIVLASLLSFVVLYNLSNINIHERKREIATLKVLGFYHNEVDNYISKESTILSIIGVAFGLILGYFLSLFVIQTVELEKAIFMKEIKFMSFVYSSILTIVFTLIINYVTHYLLKKINMVESLKSVE